MIVQDKIQVVSREYISFNNRYYLIIMGLYETAFILNRNVEYPFDDWVIWYDATVGNDK